MTVKRTGFACKYSELHPIKGVVSVPEYNTGTTTISWLNRQSRPVAEQRLWDLMKHNIESIKQVVTKLGTFDPELRLVRLTSDVLPAYTHADYKAFWQQADVQRYMEQEFAKIGDIARRDDVRLSFHPGQFTVLASENPGIVENAIEEFEYHVDMIRMMGYGKKFGDFKCNVHVAGKRGPDGMREAYSRLSPEARNTITVENEENSWGLDACLSLSDIIPTVLDIHHYFIREGEYIQADDDRVKQVIDSWRGVRPVFHYSQSREDCLMGHPTDVLPDMKVLLAAGYKKAKLRAHSDYMWNNKVNEWALTHLQWADCMVESKAKNLASMKLFEFWKNTERSMIAIFD
jgi:UV DNA damage repair endonuclease